MDVPSTAAGKVAEVSVKKGDRVSKGSAVVVLESADADAPAKPAAPPPAPRRPQAAAGRSGKACR